MTEKEKEAYNFFKKCNEKDLENFDYFSEPSKLQIKYIETVLNLIQTQQEKIEYYKKQKYYDDKFKHELLEEIRCKSLEIDSLNKVLDDRLIRIQGGRGLYAKLRGLDKEYLIREYLSMYKMCKAEIEKKNKIIDEMANKLHKLALYYDDEGTYCEIKKEICDELDNVEDIHKHCTNCIKKYFINKVEKESK